MRFHGFELKVEDGWANIYDLETGSIEWTFPETELPQDDLGKYRVMRDYTLAAEAAIVDLVDVLSDNGFEVVPYRTPE